MRRRDFIGVLGGAVVWPLTARAQQPERMRRIVMLISTSADDPDAQGPFVAAFLQGLQQLGWTDGHNVRIDARWGASNPDRIRECVAELAKLAPDIIFAIGPTTLGPLLLWRASSWSLCGAICKPASSQLAQS
jgi:putative ABC transport system substrate-binding protein